MLAYRDPWGLVPISRVEEPGYNQRRLQDLQRVSKSQTTRINQSAAGCELTGIPTERSAY